MNPFSDEPSENNKNPFSNENNMNPFSDEPDEPEEIDPLSNVINDLLKEDKNIELWVVDRGKKCDTYISHLPYSEEELHVHLKFLKKKLGCGGSVQNSKDFETEEFVQPYFRIHIQGNKKTYIKDYFTQLGIKNIKVKG